VRLYKILSWLIILVFAGLFIYLQAMPYDACIILISKISGYSKIDKLAGLLTPAKFNLLKFAPLVLVFIGVLMLVFSRPILKTITFIADNFAVAYKYIINNFRSFSRTERVFFWLVILANFIVKCYYAWNFTITYDEAWTYLNFTDRGIISSMTYYSAPNNHILNSILTNIFNHLPLPVTFRIRLPSILASIFFLIIFYVFSKRWLNSKIAMLLLLILSFLTPELFYAFTARGYIWVILFSAICYFIAIRLKETRAGETRNFFYFSLCAILGFYTMPSFLYPYATLNIYLLVYALANKRIALARKLIVWGIITIIGVLLLYMPIFAISGIDSVLSNQYVVPIPRDEVMTRLWPHMLDVFEYLFTYRYAIFIVYALLIFACFYSSNKKIAVLNLWIVVFMAFIPILHSVVPFARTWVYLTVPILISLGLVLQKALPATINRVVYYVSGICLSVLMLVTSHAALQGIEHYALSARKATDFAMKENMTSIFIKEPLMDTYLLYSYKVNGRTLDCVIFEKDFQQKQNSVEYLLIKKGQSVANTAGQPVFSNQYFDIYKNASYINSIKN
jgi:hypothetical protein